LVKLPSDHLFVNAPCHGKTLAEHPPAAKTISRTSRERRGGFLNGEPPRGFFFRRRSEQILMSDDCGLLIFEVTEGPLPIKIQKSTLKNRQFFPSLVKTAQSLWDQ